MRTASLYAFVRAMRVYEYRIRFFRGGAQPQKNRNGLDKLPVKFPFLPLVATGNRVSYRSHKISILHIFMFCEKWRSKVFGERS